MKQHAPPLGKTLPCHVRMQAPGSPLSLLEVTGDHAHRGFKSHVVCALQALLEAEAKGENWKALGLKEAPHFVESDGSIKVPQRWNNILASAERALASPNRTPPRTPPPTPPKSTLPLSLPAPK